MRKIVLIFISLVCLSASNGADYNFNRPQFTDQDLEQLLKNSFENKTSGIIWIWSPRMILSYKGYQELRPISILLQLDVTYLVDPFVTETEIINTSISQELFNSKTMNSKVLSNLGGLIHYPVLIIYENGQIKLPSRPGYDEPWRLYDYLARRLR